MTLVDVLLGLAAVGVTVWWAADTAPPGADRDTVALWVWGSMIALLVGLVPQVVVHELGHLLAAKAMRLRVLGVRIWWLHLGRERQRLAGSSGHVIVDVGSARQWVAVRMVLFSVGGPAANLALAAVTATVVVNQSVPTWLRAGAVGVTVAGLVTGVGNVVPRRPSNDLDSDGLKVLQWTFRAADRRARVAATTDIARLRASAATGHRRDHTLAAVDDPRPEVAVAAMSELLSRRPRSDDGWGDFDVVARFAARLDVSGDVRAKVSGNYSMSLALAYLGSLGADEQADPTSPEVQRIAHLAELASAADREAQSGRTAMGLTRVIQNRPAEARAVLIDIDPSASPAAQARAYAVRGIAEAELGDVSQAVSLGVTARRIAPDEVLIKLLDAVVASKTLR